MAMSKKDYVAIAAQFMKEKNHLKEHFEKDSSYEMGATYGIEVMARRLSDVMARDNPRFDRDRFLAACGVAP